MSDNHNDLEAAVSKDAFQALSGKVLDLERQLARRKRPIVARVLTVAGVVFAASALGFGALTAAGVDALRIDAEGQVHILETITIGGAATINGAATVTGIVSAGSVTTGGEVAAEKVTATSVAATGVTSNSANFGKLTVTAGSEFSGGRHHFQDEENSGPLRVGSAWNMPGIAAENNRPVVVGSTNAVHLGNHGRFLSIDGAGNTIIRGNLTVEGAADRFSVSHKTPGESTEINPDLLAQFCGDGDGCEVRLSYTDYDAVPNGPASRGFLLYCDSTCRHWRTSIETLGTDANNQREDVLQAWDCYFSDDIWIKSVQQNDPKRGFGLMVWFHDPGAKNRACHLTIID